MHFALTPLFNVNPFTILTVTGLHVSHFLLIKLGIHAPVAKLLSRIIDMNEATTP